MSSFYSEEELLKMNFKYLGKNILLSKKCSLYSIDKIAIDDNSRIDDFCILSGNIIIGKNVHIAAGCYLFTGNYSIVFKDFSGLSSQSAIYAMSDDYSGKFLTNPMLPDKYRNLLGGDVIIGKHVVIGSGSTILPNVKIGDGCSVGAKSLINKSLDEWGIYFGIPAKFYKFRSKKVLELEEQFKQNDKK